MFTEDELDLMLSALDAWVREPSAMHMASLPMLIALADDENDVRADFDESGRNADVESKKRNYVATLLKAKVIQLTNAGVVGSASEFLRSKND